MTIIQSLIPSFTLFYLDALSLFLYSAKLSKHPQATPLTLESLQAQAQMLQAKYGSGRQSSFSAPKQNSNEHEFAILPVGEENSEYRQEMNKGHGVPLTGQ